MSGAADDGGLLRRYAEEGDEGAFAVVVGRHLDWVYSAALRRVRDPGMAEDVTQATFLMMAKRAGKLAGHVSVAGWLFAVMSYSVKAAMRRERIRKVHEMRAMEMKMDALDEEKCWGEMEGKLEMAVERLGSGDREAILLRFYQRMSFGEMGSVLGVGEDGARKRVMRAVGKLRERLGGEAGVLSAVLLSRVVSVAPPTLKIGAVAGVKSGGALAIFEGAKAMMMTAKIKMAAAVVAAVMIPLAVGGVMVAARGEAGAQTSAAEIILSKETTGITGPLHGDGTPDYIAALNAKYSAGVTPENNAFVAWMELVGESPNVISIKTKGEIFRMAGVKNIRNVRYEQFYDYLNAHGIKDEANMNAQGDMTTASQRIWGEKDFATLAAYLGENEEGLNAMAAIWGREKYWQPWVATDGRSMYSTSLVSLGQARQTGSALLARATLRMGEGDFKGFLADVRTEEELSRHFEKSATLIERLVGASLERYAAQTIGAVAGTGMLTSAQAAEVTKMLEEVGASPDMTEPVEVQERWDLLDKIFLVRAGMPELMVWADEMNAQTTYSLKDIDRSAVDWNVVLRMANETMDEIAAAMRGETVEEVMAGTRGVRLKLPDVKKGEAISFRREAGETGEAYTQRIGGILLRLNLFDPGRAEVLHRETAMRTACAEVVLAAGRYRAEKGKWPENLGELEGAYLKKVPEDLYMPGEMVKYWKGEEGIWVYSVGANRIDEAGKDKMQGGDDIGVGAYRAGKVKFDAPAPYLSRDDSGLEGFPSIIR